MTTVNGTKPALDLTPTSTDAPPDLTSSDPTTPTEPTTPTTPTAPDTRTTPTDLTDAAPPEASTPTTPDTRTTPHERDTSLVGAAENQTDVAFMRGTRLRRAGLGRCRAAERRPEGPGRVRSGRVAVVLLVAAVGIGGLGAWFTVQASGLRGTDAAANTALVDTGATAEVSTAVTTSLNKVFSYSFDKPEVTERDAAEVLRGPALDTYDRLFAQVRELAPQQKIVLSTRVVNVAVQSIVDDRARLLVFLDQSATRADNDTTSNGAAQLSVTAERQDGRWMIIDLTPR